MTASGRHPARWTFRTYLTWLLLLAASLGLGAGIVASRAVDPVSNLIYDALVKIVPPVPVKNVVIVAIDDESIAQLGAWPWPRQVHAALLNRLKAAGARAVLYDILFTEPTNSVDDGALADALRSGPLTALPLLFEVPGRDGRAISVERPIAGISGPTVRFGHAVLQADRDGICRQVALYDSVDGTSIPHVALLASGVAAPPDRAAQRIAFAARGSVPTVPFAEVLNGHVAPEFLAGKTILVGTTAPGLGDRYATPAVREGVLVPGIEVLASIVSGLQEHRLIDDAGFVGSFGLLGVTLCLLMTGFIFFGPRANLVIAVGLALLTCVASALLLMAQTWCDPSPALLCLLILFPAWGWYRLYTATLLIDDQLTALRAEAGLLDAARGNAPVARSRGGDWLGRQMTALEAAIAQNVDLRQFVQVSFGSLPDPAIVVDSSGIILLANGQADALYRHYTGSAMPLRMMALSRALFSKAGTARRALQSQLRAVPGSDGSDIALPGDRYFSLRRSVFNTSDENERFSILRLVETTRQRRAERDREHALEFLSHDLRGPQASIIGILDATALDLDPQLKARLRGHAQRTLGMAQAFIDIARAQGGLVDTQPFDLADIVQELMDSFWQDLRAKAVIAVPEWPPRPCVVRGDPQLVSRALENLLRNALKYSPTGATIRIRLQQRVHGNGRAHAAFVIDDHGPGIAAATVDRIFDRFQTGNRRSGGTGLGLTMVRATADRFSGRVRCYSRVNTGSRFVFELPLVDAAAISDL